MSDWMDVRAARKELEAINICSFRLISADGPDLPFFSAGSHVDVLTPAGLTRQYSLCNSPGGNELYEIGVLLQEVGGRGGSRSMHEGLGPQCVSLERLLQLRHKPAELAKPRRPAIGRHLHDLWRPQPAAHRVALQARALGDFMQRHLVAQIHPSNSSQHFHGDHLVRSLPKI